MTDRLRVDVDGHVATLTLTAPELLNRFDREFHTAFLEAVDELARSDARAVVLAAEGACFSAGGDADLMLALHDNPSLLDEMRPEGRRMLEAMPSLPMPVVCALQGDAIGLGASIVLGCDAIVAARSAKISDPHVAFGLVAGDGGCVVWPLALGLMPARHFLLTGDALNAEQGQALGVIQRVVDDPAAVLPAAVKIAERIASLPPMGVQGTKAALTHLFRQRVDEVFHVAVESEIAAIRSNDLLEAVAAFKERRRGVFTGT